jgi:hypothetical protein
VDALLDPLVKRLVEYIKRRIGDSGTMVREKQIKNHMMVFVNCLVDSPSFDSQVFCCAAPAFLFFVFCFLFFVLIRDVLPNQKFSLLFPAFAFAFSHHHRFFFHAFVWGDLCISFFLLIGDSPKNS